MTQGARGARWDISHNVNLLGLINQGRGGAPTAPGTKTDSLGWSPSSWALSSSPETQASGWSLESPGPDSGRHLGTRL